MYSLCLQFYAYLYQYMHFYEYSENGLMSGPRDCVLGARSAHHKPACVLAVVADVTICAVLALRNRPRGRHRLAKNAQIVTFATARRVEAAIGSAPTIRVARDRSARNKRAGDARSRVSRSRQSRELRRHHVRCRARGRAARPPPPTLPLRCGRAAREPIPRR